jgi:tRNA threonylcarbamoyladenosine biosynthesis protein TsaE
MADSRLLDGPEATAAAGQMLAAAMRAAGADELIVYLVGDLGAGKTTFARGFLHGWGHTGRVPSPTYTLIEPYEFEGLRIYHIDLYRLNDALEADHLGLAELPGPRVVMLIEWPERAADRLPAPDLTIMLEVVANHRRSIEMTPSSAAGERLLAHKSMSKGL